MEIAAPPIQTASGSRRAGFWRRAGATLIDALIVVAPIQIVAAILFAATAGSVQMTGGFTYTTCTPAPGVPQSLSPPPPRGANSTRVCRISFFGAQTASLLQVNRVTRVGSTTTSVGRTYTLDTAGNPNQAIMLDWVALLSLLIYLVAMLTKSGRTLGNRVVGLLVVDVAQPGTSHVPIRKIIMRYLAMMIGAVPLLAILLFRFATAPDLLEEPFPAGMLKWFVGGAAVFFVWGLINLVQVARKRDPIYDALAGTAVVRL